MNPLNPFAVSGLVMVALYLPLATFLFIKGKSRVAKIYGFYLFAIAMWGIGAFLIAIIKDITLVTVVWKAAYAWAVFIPVFFYHSIYAMTERRTAWELYAIYAQAIFFIIAIYRDAMLANYRIMFGSFYFHIATPTFTASFLVWVIVISVGHLLLFSFYRKTYPTEKQELKAILYLTLIGFGGGIMNFFPPYGLNLYPYGNFITVAPGIAISYAILKHQFLDIKIVFKKSLAYSFLLLCLSLLYLAIVITVEKTLQSFWGYHSPTVSVITAFIIGLCFFPLHNRIQSLVDRFIFKRTTDEIAEENELLRQEIIKSEKMKGVATLASGMAHEIKNPLTAIKTFSEYLPEKLDDKEFLRRFSRIVGSEVERIDSLVNELLEFAKPSPLQLKKINLNKLLKETLDFLNSKFIQQGVTLKTGLDPACDTPIDADPSKLKQVLLNILLNALEAMPAGGQLTVATLTNYEPRTTNYENPTNDERNTKNANVPRSSFHVRQNNIQIVISDTGIGIPKENIKRIFDPFYSTKDHGTGLGLPIVHQIMKEHGGTVEVESEVGRGTTITLSFPLGTAECGTPDVERRT